MEMVGWQEKIKRQLDVVERWRQSGTSVTAWAPAHGVDTKLLMGWVAYEKRWQQRLAALAMPSRQSCSADPRATRAVLKTTAPASTPARPKGFVAAQRIDTPAHGSVASSAAANKASDCVLGTGHPSPASVRMECAGLVLYWPLSQTQELAALLMSMRAHGDASTSTLGGDAL